MGKFGNNWDWLYSFFDSTCIFRDASSGCGWAVGKLWCSFKLHYMDEGSYMVNCPLPGSGAAAKWEYPGAWLGRVSYKQIEPENEQSFTLGKGKNTGAPSLVIFKSKARAGVGDKVNWWGGHKRKWDENVRTLGQVGMGCLELPFLGNQLCEA